MLKSTRLFSFSFAVVVVVVVAVVEESEDEVEKRSRVYFFRWKFLLEFFMFKRSNETGENGGGNADRNRQPLMMG